MIAIFLMGFASSSVLNACYFARSVPVSPVLSIRTISATLSAFQLRYLLSFRMISDTRIECQNASSQRETAAIGPTGSGRGRVEPGGPGAVDLDGFLSLLPQRSPYLPSLWHQPPDVLSLATAL